jgi:hypothetical protein
LQELQEFRSCRIRKLRVERGIQEPGERHRTEDTEGTEGVEVTVPAVFLAASTRRIGRELHFYRLLFSDSRLHGGISEA